MDDFLEGIDAESWALEAIGDDPEFGPGTGGTHYTDKKTITEVQQKLEQLGYFHGVVDGKYGPVTEAAIFNFSGVHGPPDDAVLAKIRSAAAVKSAVTSSNKIVDTAARGSSAGSYSSLIKPGGAQPQAELSFWQRPVGSSGLKTWQVATISVAGAGILAGIIAAVVKR